MTEDLEIHIIELPKIKEKMEEGKLKKWILFLENPEGEETKKMAELRQKYIMDREAELETAEEKGIKKRTIE